MWTYKYINAHAEKHTHTQINRHKLALGTFQREKPSSLSHLWCSTPPPQHKAPAPLRQGSRGTSFFLLSFKETPMQINRITMQSFTITKTCRKVTFLELGWATPGHVITPMCASMFTRLETTPVSTLFKMPMLVTCPPRGQDHMDMSEDLQRQEADALKALMAPGPHETRCHLPRGTGAASRRRRRWGLTAAPGRESRPWGAARTCLEHSAGRAVMVEGSSLLQSRLRPLLRAWGDRLTETSRADKLSDRASPAFSPSPERHVPCDSASHRAPDTLLWGQWWCPHSLVTCHLHGSPQAPSALPHLGPCPCRGLLFTPAHQGDSHTSHPGSELPAPGPARSLAPRPTKHVPPAHPPQHPIHPGSHMSAAFRRTILSSWPTYLLGCPPGPH